MVPVAAIDAELEAADAPLAALIRTVMTVAVTKTAISLVDVFVQLQAANGSTILTTHTGHAHRGVQQFLHAAATLLREEQNSV